MKHQNCPKNCLLYIKDLKTKIGGNAILNGINLELFEREILGLVGGSGVGKSVLLRTILGLQEKSGGKIEYPHISGEFSHKNIGVLFQHGALFSSLTVKENIQLPMRKYMQTSPELADNLATMRMDLVGLPRSAADKYPSQLSGGMIKRAGLARALALDAKMLFLDEPTSGLDPISARGIESLILSLRENLGLSVLLVTHDIESLSILCDRIAVLRNRKILTSGTINEVKNFPDKWIKAYFHKSDKE